MGLEWVEGLPLVTVFARGLSGGRCLCGDCDIEGLCTLPLPAGDDDDDGDVCIFRISFCGVVVDGDCGLPRANTSTILISPLRSCNREGDDTPRRDMGSNDTAAAAADPFVQ